MERASQPRPAARAARSDQGKRSGRFLRTAAGRGGGRRSPSGFTLVELLVVIGILTLLIACLAPVFFIARNKSHDTVCLSNLKQVGQALNLYTADWDGILPAAPGSPLASGLDPLDLQSFRDLRSPSRPSQSTYVRSLLLSDHRGLVPENFRCPNDAGEEAFNFSQGSVYDSAFTSYLWDPASDAARIFARTADGSTSEPVNGAYVDGLKDATHSRLFQDYGSLWHTKIQNSFAVQEAGQDYRVNQGFVNALFADGHVDKVATDNYERVASKGKPSPGDPTAASNPDTVSPTR